jgi:hypothetical protein
MFVNGTGFTLTANFADGSTATASTTINALAGFSDNFSGNLSNWTFVDQGNFEGPSSWVISNGELIQRSNIYGGSTSASDPVKPGTYALAGNALWQDYDFSLRLMSEDDDTIGATFRYIDNSITTDSVWIESAPCGDLLRCQRGHNDTGPRQHSLREDKPTI